MKIKNVTKWRILTALKDWAESRHYARVAAFAIRNRG